MGGGDDRLNFVGDPTPLGVFWKDVQAKELAEGVCERCVDKGLTAGGKEIEEAWKVGEAEEKGMLVFIA